ncbi:MAG TPA: FAD-dependent oxidoreductase [Patescibacteria group bacterium]|nr:FAD-dependent oxidoreductase [Patescibacteria group bacterium]
MIREQVDVLVVGGGPGGLAAAIELRRRGVGRILVVDREKAMGGIPRHSDHLGYGLIDLHRPMTGPQYARRCTRDALAAGADLRVETSVVGWAGERLACATGPTGIREIEADAVILAMGCRERPRSARMVPGTRPAGIFTTGSLQQFVHLHGRAVGRRAVVVGAEHVSFSALLTLSHAKVKTVAILTDQPRHQTYPALALVTATRLRVPILAGHRLTGIRGRERVAGVEVTDLASGSSRVIPCDTVVFTADWIPDHELARLAGLEMDPGTNGPRVDTALRTSAPGIFAVGNVLHGAETSDVAAAEGRHVAAGVQEWLASGAWASEAPIAMVGEEPIAWISPNVVRVGAAATPPSGHFTLRVRRFVERPRLEVRQAGRTLWRGRPRSGMLASFLPGLPEALLHGALVPGRPVHLPADWVPRVRRDGGEVLVRVLE